MKSWKNDINGFDSQIQGNLGSNPIDNLNINVPKIQRLGGLNFEVQNQCPHEWIHLSFMSNIT